VSESLDERISLEELQLAARNHAMPLEALRWDLTPIGLHYLLIHYDIPQVDPASWRLEVGGLVERPLALSLDELRARPSVEVAVTMECAGNGRAHVEPRVVSQPWLLEAVGTARWRGTPVAPLLQEAGVRDGAVEVLFTGLDRGVEGGEEQAYERSLPVSALLDGEALLAYEVNGVPLPPQHGHPLRLVVPGWYGMTSVKWLERITVLDAPFSGYQMSHSYRVRLDEDEPAPEPEVLLLDLLQRREPVGAEGRLAVRAPGQQHRDAVHDGVAGAVLTYERVPGTGPHDPPGLRAGEELDEGWRRHATRGA